MRTSNAIRNAFAILMNKKESILCNKWQAVNIENRMFEVTDLFLQMDMCSSIKELELETKADLPWSENHFKERLAGPTNPGYEYQNWPYYSKKLDDSRFRSNKKFSHTYQERFWPVKKTGIRFKMGDYLDIQKRLKNDHTTRQAFLSIWHPEDQSNNDVRLPCTIGYWFKIDNNVLNITYLIRSCDARRHFKNDVYMTQRLALDMLSYLDDESLKLGRMSMWIGSFHCFEQDKYFINKQLKK